MELTLSAKERVVTGKGVRALRHAGYVPAELYGHGLPNQHFSVKEKDFTKIFKEAGMNTLVTLLCGNEKHRVLVHDIQRNYITNGIEHIDFYQVSLKEEIKARIPIEFVGEAPAVKEKGGVLNKAMLEIEVQALPDHLPHRFEVPLERLVELNHSFYVKDFDVPKGVKMLVDPETVIATVTPMREEEEVVVKPADVTDVKVEDEEKTAKRQAEKEIEKTE